MKCIECPEYMECRRLNDLRIKRKSCAKAKEPQKTTNADRIRSMTDEELANWVWGAESAGRAYGPRGKMAWLDWLKQECER